MPVLDIQQRGQPVGPQPGCGHEPGEQGHGGEHAGDERGQQPPRPRLGERPGVDATRTGQLVQQELGDQESAEGEEHFDAEESASCPGQVEVIGEHGEHGQAAHAVEPGRVGHTRGRPQGPHAPGTHPNRHVHSAHLSPLRMRGRTRPWRSRPVTPSVSAFHPSRCLIPAAAARARPARPGSPGDLPLTKAAGMRRRRRGAGEMAPAGPGTSRRRGRAGSFGNIVGKCAAAVAGVVEVARRSFSLKLNGFQRARRSERSAAVVVRDRSARPPAHTTPAPPRRSRAGPGRSAAPTPTSNERITGASAPTPGRLTITPSPRRSG